MRIGFLCIRVGLLSIGCFALYCSLLYFFISVLCPQCRVVNPLDDLDCCRFDPHRRVSDYPRHGLGLGFTRRDLEDIAYDLRQHQQDRDERRLHALQGGGRLSGPAEQERDHEYQAHPQHYRMSNSRIELRSTTGGY